MEIVVHVNVVISVPVTLSYVTLGPVVTDARDSIVSVCNVCHVARFSNVYRKINAKFANVCHVVAVASFAMAHVMEPVSVPYPAVTIANAGNSVKLYHAATDAKSNNVLAVYPAAIKTAVIYVNALTDAKFSIVSGDAANVPTDVTSVPSVEFAQIAIVQGSEIVFVAVWLVWLV